jgi:hypothetical protein
LVAVARKGENVLRYEVSDSKKPFFRGIIQLSNKLLKACYVSVAQDFRDNRRILSIDLGLLVLRQPHSSYPLSDELEAQ